MCMPAALLAIVLIRAEYFYVRHVSHKFVAVNMEYRKNVSLHIRAHPLSHVHEVNVLLSDWKLFNSDWRPAERENAIRTHSDKVHWGSKTFRCVLTVKLQMPFV
jgi:hypothetical protein